MQHYEMSIGLGCVSLIHSLIRSSIQTGCNKENMITIPPLAQLKTELSSCGFGLYVLSQQTFPELRTPATQEIHCINHDYPTKSAMYTSLLPLLLALSLAPTSGAAATFGSVSAVVCSPKFPDTPIGGNSKNGPSGIYRRDCAKLCVCHGEPGSTDIKCHSPDGSGHLNYLDAVCTSKDGGNCQCASTFGK